MNHHFNPRFYLDRWAGPDKRLCEMRFIRGNVVARREFPVNTGCLKDLYRIDGVPDALSQNLETKFFAPLDTKAARALWTMLDGGLLELEDRASWARFLLSLLYRNREGVTLIKDHMADLVRATKASLEDHWARHRRADERRSLAEATEDREPALVGTHAANILADTIGNHRALPDILKMRWVIINLRRSKIPLLTSDCPVFFGALSDPSTYIALAVGPYDLFVAAFNDRFSRANTNASGVAYQMNRDVVSNGREFVWGLLGSRR